MKRNLIFSSLLVAFLCLAFHSGTNAQATEEIMTNEEVITLAKAGLSIDAVRRLEINEAFCSVVVNSSRMLAADPAKVNVNGGAVALGHPIGASGARILTTLIYALKDRGLKRGIATLCLGGGNGVALAIEMP